MDKAEERAWRAWNEHDHDKLSDLIDKIAQVIREAVEEAHTEGVLAEREQCCHIIRTWASECQAMREGIAQCIELRGSKLAIRARGKP